MPQFQKQPPDVFYRKTFCNIHRKTPVLESPFNRLAGFKTCNFFKKRLRHRCFPVNIAKTLRAPILMKIWEQLLLSFLLLTANISSKGLIPALSSIGLLQRFSLMFEEFSLGCLAVASSLIWKKEKLAEMVALCHSLYHLLLLVATRFHSLYHSLSLVVPLVVICCYSLSFVVTRFTTRCHSLSLDVLLACLFINNLEKHNKSQISLNTFFTVFQQKRKIMKRKNHMVHWMHIIITKCT